MGLCKTPSYWVSSYLTKFQRNPSRRFKIGKGGTSVRAHVQMHSTHDICPVHRGLVYKRTPNFVTIGLSIHEL